MKLIRLTSLFILAAIYAVMVGRINAQGRSGESDNGIAAIVNGKVITKNEVAEATKYQLMVMRQAVNDPAARARIEREARDRALQDLVDREVIISEFERSGAKIKPQYIDEDIQRIIRENFKGQRDSFMIELKRQGLSWPRFKDLHEKKLIVGAMRSHATQNVSFPRPDQKREFFQKNEELFREEGAVFLRTIAIPAVTGESGLPIEQQREKQQKLIIEIRRRLLNGADFASEAKTYSQDSKASAGGDWGLVTRSTLAKRLADVAFSIPVKTISQVFEFHNHFYLITVDERRVGKLKPPAEIEQLLDRLVQVEEKKRVSEEWLNRLRRKAVIRYPDPAYRPQSEQSTPNKAPLAAGRHPAGP
ncbi:MAG: peptidylprolyl isomerase [Verrucomicrobiales bacterium]